MKDGVYYMVFKSSLEAFGEGVLVICCGEVNGGDIGFVYQGILDSPMMTLNVIRHHDDIPSALGMERNYQLVMHYHAEQDGEYEMHGHVKGHPELTIEAHVRFLVPLVHANTECVA